MPLKLVPNTEQSAALSEMAARFAQVQACNAVAPFCPRASMLEPGGAVSLGVLPNTRTVDNAREPDSVSSSGLPK